MKTWIVSSLDEETIQGEETNQGRKLYEEIRYVTNKEFLISKVCCFNSVLYEIKWLDVASAYKTREMTPHHSGQGYANAYGGSKSVWLAAKPIFNVRVFMKTLHRASFSTGAWSASDRQPQSLGCLILTAMCHIVVTLHKMFKKLFVIQVNIIWCPRLIY